MNAQVPSLENQIDNFTNLLNYEMKQFCKERQCETSSAVEIIGTVTREYWDVEDAFKKRHDLKFRMEFFDFILKTSTCFVDCQRKVLSVA